ncbi:Small nuclear RNA activating complex, polypeptide 1, 43kDa [Clonorchis sinensis]|uniref:snRNA-activating protein complex subunit 1 n=2 Tax=Clonorchis sinensis TaxID=79923 RepID=G7Y9V0_CLOSI|nr:Small nuclear RNA activating complex, polypeptide 1, 43kDa [Clonorchis sinensis]GAA49734.1 snRNA-activating protein complex subunit 1 [Clonorchis sinensis]
MKEIKPFVFRTSFNPVHGIDEDLHAFIQKFEQVGGIRFMQFSELWCQEKFIHLIYGRQNQAGLSDLLGCLFYRLVDLVQPHKDRTHLGRICALYLLYAFHGKQPVRNQVRIRVCPETWNGIVQLANEARDDGHLDVYYVFRQLCAANAFSFCLLRQVLYPGVPLFDSPQMKAETFEAVSKKTTKNPISPYLSLIEAPKTSQVQLHEALCSLDASIKEYTAAKSLLDQAQEESPHVEDVRPATSSGDEEEMNEEFLPGLNFITHPNSLQKLSRIIQELDEEHDSFEKHLVIEDTPKKNVSTDTVENSPLSSPHHVKQTSPSYGQESGSGPNTRSKRSLPASTSVGNHPESGTSNVVPCTEHDKGLDDIGTRRRLLKQPSTWKGELRQQMESVRAHGCRRNRARPMEPKLSRPHNSNT